MSSRTGEAAVGADHLLGEMVLLRHRVRLLVGVWNANPSRWFAGSPGIQEAARKGLVTELLMGIRRIGVRGKRGEWSLPQVLLATAAECDGADVGRAVALRAAAEDVREVLESAAGRHLKALADKAIAHPNPSGLAAQPQHPDGANPEQFTVRMISEVIAKLTDIWMRHLGLNLGRPDAAFEGRDPFILRLREVGLPAVDFSPDAIFLPGADDGETLFMPMEVSTWTEVVGLLPLPFTEGMALADLRWHRIRAAVDDDVLVPTVVEFAARWGWELDAAGALCREWRGRM